MKLPKKEIIKIFLAGFLLCAFLTYPIFIYKIFNHKEGDREKSVNFLRQITGNYKFISPLLDSGSMSEQESLLTYKYENDLRNELLSEINKYQDITVGLLFHDLENSSWFGINEDENFVPASLLKIPMMIAYYKLNENDRSLFAQKVVYNGTDFDKRQNIPPTEPIQPNKEYTIKQLIDAMILDSDNNALEFLYQYKKDALREVFEDLQIPLPQDRESIANKDYLSVKDQARFFLVLYNGSYLTKEDSEEALKLLSETKYNDGLTKYLPKNVVVSHKFGERIININNENNLQEFHDCGIVYLKHSYKICIMTKGNDLNKQQEIVSKLSKIIYDKIEELIKTSMVKQGRLN